MIGDVRQLLWGQTNVERVQDRAHGGNRTVGLQMFLVAPLEGGHALVCRDAKTAQRIGKASHSRQHNAVRRSPISISGRSDDLAVTVYGCRMLDDRRHRERNILHCALHRVVPFQAKRSGRLFG